MLLKTLKKGVIKESSKTKLILVALVLLLVGPVVFSMVKKNLKKKASRFTPLFQKNLEKVNQEAPQVGFLAPDFTLKDLQDQIVSLSDFKGKNVLLVFWATTCGWCAYEKNDLIRFTNDKKREIEVIAIVNEPKETVLEYVQKEEINFTILLDKGMITFEKYRVLGTPVHVLINKEGKVVEWQPGATDYEGLLWFLGRLKNNG